MMSTTEKIQSASRSLRIAIFVLLVTIPLFEVCYLLSSYASMSSLPPFLLQFIPFSMQTQLPRLHTMSFIVKAVGLVSFFQKAVIMMICLMFLARLFKYYQNLQVFSTGAILCIRNIGYTLLIGQLLNLIITVVLFSSLPLSFPISSHTLMGVFFATLGQSSIIIGGAVCIIVISWIMKMGREIQVEQEHTI